MNQDDKKQKGPPSTKEDIDRSDWEGMGQQRFQPHEHEKGDAPLQVEPKDKTLGPTPGANAIAGQIQK